MSLTSYRAAPPRVRAFRVYFLEGYLRSIMERMSLFRFGGDLLSHDLGRSTIGAVALIFRVREGIGSFAYAMTTKPRKYQLLSKFFAILYALI